MKSAIIAAVTLFMLAAACTTEKTVYVLPDGTEVTPTAAQATQAAGGGSQAAVPPSMQSPTPTAIISREDRLIRLVIENAPPTCTGYGLHRSCSFTPDCVEFYYSYGSSISGRPPKFTYAPGMRGVSSVVIDCDDDGNHYFTDDRWVDMLWEYLGGE
ncbi:MAG: hypothetical protein OXH22_07000 [Chloroflexi bacterium]|nr:hypothetical protein [Chloroflexota bacterium]